MKKILVPLGLSALIVLFLALAVLWQPTPQTAPKSGNGNVTDSPAPVSDDSDADSTGSAIPSAGTGAEDGTATGSDS